MFGSLYTISIVSIVINVLITDCLKKSETLIEHDLEKKPKDKHFCHKFQVH